MKILVVDDDKTTRKLLSLYLKGKGYDVITAENGLDAMEKVGTEDPNFILTDMNMPYMDGIEFTKNIKSDPVLKAIPVVMVTTEADEDERERAFKAGVDEYLIKPVNAEQVAEAVMKILKKIFKGGSADV